MSKDVVKTRRNIGPHNTMTNQTYSDLSTSTHFNSCAHQNTVVETIGIRSFSEGEVSDNLEERILCLDCLEYLTEADHAGDVEIPIWNS